MIDFNSISEELGSQFNVIEKDAQAAAERIKNVEGYINCRIVRAKKLIHLMKNSKNWANKLPRIINILGDVQRMVDKIEEVEISMTPIEEICIDDLEYISSLVDKKLMEYSDG
jgi:hypothetical protein